MISSLEEARGWYDGVRTLAQDMGRIGSKFWDQEPLATLLGRDNRFRSVDSSGIVLRVRTVLDDLDDLGVLMLFSVFESIVRDQAIVDIEASISQALHPSVEWAVDNLKEDIRGSSFKRVIDSFKAIGPGLIEEVSQVRLYRNWVAHGRRGEKPVNLDPPMAYDRLSRFLKRMSEVAQSSGPDAAGQSA